MFNILLDHGPGPSSKPGGSSVALDTAVPVAPKVPTCQAPASEFPMQHAGQLPSSTCFEGSGGCFNILLAHWTPPSTCPKIATFTTGSYLILDLRVLMTEDSPGHIFHPLQFLIISFILTLNTFLLIPLLRRNMKFLLGKLHHWDWAHFLSLISTLQQPPFFSPTKAVPLAALFSVPRKKFPPVLIS